MAALTSSINYPSTTQRLLGKVAIVTGGATGIGESIVRVFHKHGAKICILDINDDAGKHVCESLGNNSNICFIHCDVTKEEDVQNAVNFTVKKFGGLDIMVNNAAIANPLSKDIRLINTSSFESIFDTNVKGVFIGMKHAARIMIPLKKGSIISICSVAAIIAGLGDHAYVASKNAILGLTKNVAAELGKYGIRVNCVSPYAVLTKMALDHLPKENRTDEDVSIGFRTFANQHANLKGVELMVDDIANAVVFLASDEGRYISGDNLVVDGGFSSVNHSLRLFK